jgi:hypothetical protein
MNDMFRLLFNGELIPSIHIVNGETIYQDEELDNIE